MKLDKKELKNDLRVFLILAALGVILKNINLQFPGQPFFIEISPICVYLGVVLLARKWMSFFVMFFVSFPTIQGEIGVGKALIGNSLFFIPFILFMWFVYTNISSKIKNSRWIAVLWGIAILIGYQLFTTPIIWAYLGFLEDGFNWNFVLEGIKQQPFLLESLIVSVISSSVVLVTLNERVLIKSKKRLLTLLNNLHDGVIVVDQKNSVEFINPVARNLLNLDESEILGFPVDDVYKSDFILNLKNEDRSLEDLLTEGDREVLDHDSSVKVENSKFLIHERISAIRNNKGSLTGFIITFQDITEREKQRLELKEKLEESEVFLKAAVNREKRIVELKELLDKLEKSNA